MRRLLAPELFGDRHPFVGGERQHRVLGPLRHVADRRACGPCRLRVGRAQWRRRNIQRELRRCGIPGLRRFGELWCGLRRFRELRSSWRRRRLGRTRRNAIGFRRCKAFVEHAGRQRWRGRYARGRLLRGQRRERLLDGIGGVARGQFWRRLDHGLVITRAAEHRIDARGNDVGVNGPATTEHQARDRGPAKQIVRDGSMGRFPAVPPREGNATRAHPLAPRTVPPFPSRCFRGSVAREQHLAEGRSVIKATFS